MQYYCLAGSICDGVWNEMLGKRERGREREREGEREREREERVDMKRPSIVFNNARLYRSCTWLL